MAVALLAWVEWIIKKYEVRSRKYENASDAYLKIVSRPDSVGTGFFLRLLALSVVEGFALACARVYSNKRHRKVAH
jgi:hypothetical protein